MGRISGIYGTRGWLRIFSDTRPRENIFDYKQWYLGDENDPKFFAIADWRRNGRGLICKLSRVDDREAARTLVDLPIAVARRDFPALDAEEYYWADLIGMRVVNRNNVDLGTVRRVHETGAHDVLEVQGADVILIPFVRSIYVLAVDRDGELITVDWVSET